MKLLIYKLKRVYHFFTTLLWKALPANLFFGFPSRSMTVIAFTGTDGKTTTSSMMYQILKAAGKKTVLISTVAAYLGDEEIDTGFHVTTPDPWQIQRLLKKALDQGCEYAVLEATSHGIYQYRIWGVDIDYAGLTNITQHEALDYHVTYLEYVKAKALMLRSANKAWINRNDESYKVLKELLPKNVLKYKALEGIPNDVSAAIEKRFPQGYNQQNATLVYKIAQELKIHDKVFSQAVLSFQGVPGRMQYIPNTKGLEIVVDFAHTPNGLKQVLTYLKSCMKPNQKLIAVFGCAGQRDPGKRQPMGQIASELADYAVFTAEDPRTEDVWSIIRQMKEGVKNFDRIHTIADRESAIRYALFELADTNDVVAVFGKGHEQSMSYGSTEYAWSDIKAIERMLAHE